MKAVIAIAALLLTGCASTWQPFSDDSFGRAKAEAYERCMARHLLQTKAAEERCLQSAQRDAKTQELQSQGMEHLPKSKELQQ